MADDDKNEQPPNDTTDGIPVRYIEVDDFNKLFREYDDSDPEDDPATPSTK